MLGGRGDPKELGRLVKEAAALKLELPELPRLSKQQQERTWVDNVEEALKGAATLDTLTSLLESGRAMAQERGAEWRHAELCDALGVKL